ncbi:MAG: pitrilysin family protein [Byssovorax sp.]
MSKRASILLAAFALGACEPSIEPVAPRPPAPPPAASTAHAAASSPAPDPLATAPLPDPEPRFVPPSAEERRLPNGIRLLVTERHDLPIVALRLAFAGGADQGAPGVGSFTAAMLFQGTKKRSAIALDDDLRRLGITAEATAEYDSIAVTAQCLPDRLPEALAIMGDLVQSPAFAPDEVERVRSRRLTSLFNQSGKPATLVTEETLALLYPEGHPYRLPVVGDEASNKAIRVADLQAFHRDNLVPARLTIAVAGDVTMAGIAPQIERVFGAWKGSAASPIAPPRPKILPGPRVTLIDQPGLSQSWVTVTAMGIARTDPSFDAVSMMNTILGGYYASRLNMNLREKHGYTYVAQSSLELRRGPGPFSASATVTREQTGAALGEMWREIARIREELVSQEELDVARIRAIRRLPARFETDAAVAGVMSALSAEGLPLDEFATRADRYAKLTREDVKRAAAATLAPEALRVVVVGDAKAIKAQIDALGLGEVVVKSPPRAPRPGAVVP